MDAIPVTSARRIFGTVDETGSNLDASDAPDSEQVPPAVATTEIASQHEPGEKDGRQEEVVAEAPSEAHGEAEYSGPTVYGIAEALYDFTPQVEGDLQFNVSIVSIIC
jgi:hypothetical protein